jgi:hypothetical protein
MYRTCLAGLPADIQHQAALALYASRVNSGEAFRVSRIYSTALTSVTAAAVGTGNIKVPSLSVIYGWRGTGIYTTTDTADLVTVAVERRGRAEVLGGSTYPCALSALNDRGDAGFTRVDPIIITGTDQWSFTLTGDGTLAGTAKCRLHLKAITFWGPGAQALG